MATLVNPHRFAIAGNTYDSEVAADSPAGYWKCDDTSGTSVTDYSGNSRHLTLESGCTLNQTAVKPNSARAIDFVGSGNGFLDMSDASWQSPHAGASGLMTVECWFNSDTLAAINTLWWKGLSSNFEFSLAVTTAGALQFTVFTAAGGTAGDATSTTGLVSTGNVYHAVGTWDRAGNAIKAYLNGSEVASATTSADSADGTSSLCFGFRDSLNDRYFNGRADYLALYPTCLNSTRVAAHYAAA